MWKIERNSEYQAKGGLNLSGILWQQRSHGFATKEKEEEYWRGFAFGEKKKVS